MAYDGLPLLTFARGYRRSYGDRRDANRRPEENEPWHTAMYAMVGVDAKRHVSGRHLDVSGVLRPAWQMALQTVEHHRSHGITLKISACGKAIAACGKSAEWQTASQILSGYIIHQLEVNTISYNATMSACEKGGLWPSSLHILEDLSWHGLEASVVTTSAAISSHDTDWSRAVRLLQRIHEWQQQANVITYTSATSSYEKSSQWQVALRSLEDIELNGIQGHIFAINSCISSCQKAERWRVAFSLVHSFAQIQRDVATYNASLLCAAKAPKSWQSGLWRLRDLQILLSPSVITYNSAISVFEVLSRWQYAFLLFHELAFSRLKANITTCNSLLSAFEKAGAWQQALHFLTFLKLRRMSPDTITFNATVSACEKASMWQIALWLLFEESQLERDTVTYNSAATSCVQSSRWQYAIATLGHCKQRLGPWEKLDAISCTVGIDALSKAWQCGFAWMEELLQQDVQLDTVAYLRAISVSECAVSWRWACYLLGRARETMAPSVVTSNAAIAASGSVWNRVFQVISELRLQGLQPTLLTQNSVMQELATRDQWQWALVSFMQGSCDILTYHFAMMALEKGQQCLEAINVTKKLQRIALLHLKSLTFPDALITVRIADQPTSHPWKSAKLDHKTLMREVIMADRSAVVPMMTCEPMEGRTNEQQLSVK
eukprot:Skav203790  [mRNA]  locus=scaffold206:515169:520079:+ [translate_table: standard]